MIYLTGAGCGDFSLLTWKAKRVIEQADCILYDRLIDSQILSLVKDTCELIYVGKENHHHSLHQDAINALLVEKGKQYSCVVRLKGGDPYVFGRGSEEALYIKEHHLKFEVIPGITSAISGSGLAGIPVTHRGCALGVHIMSAHTKEYTFANMDFKAMATTQETLVFLMGLSNLKEIVECLLEAGKLSLTPIALISNAGKYNQCSVRATLATILQQDLTTILSPTIIVVGEVVEFQEKLSFMEHKPLFHKCYLMASLQYEEEVLWQFQEKGASIDILSCGTIHYLPYSLSKPIHNYSHVLFTSKHGVDAFFHQIFEMGKDVRSLAHCKLCVIGNKTAKHLRMYGCQADFISAISNSEQFAHSLKKYLKRDDSILIAKAKNHNNTLEEQLSKVCYVENVAVYETIPKALQVVEKDYDGILFTCSFSVHEMMKYINSWDHILTKPVYAMGIATRDTLRSYGFQHIVELKKADCLCFIDSVMKEEHHV